MIIDFNDYIKICYVCNPLYSGTNLQKERRWKMYNNGSKQDYMFKAFMLYFDEAIKYIKEDTDLVELHSRVIGLTGQQSHTGGDAPDSAQMKYYKRHRQKVINAQRVNNIISRYGLKKQQAKEYVDKVDLLKMMREQGLGKGNKEYDMIYKAKKEMLKKEETSSDSCSDGDEAYDHSDTCTIPGLYNKKQAEDFNENLYPVDIDQTLATDDYKESVDIETTAKKESIIEKSNGEKLEPSKK